MALALNNLKSVDIPLNKETNQTNMDDTSESLIGFVLFGFKAYQPLLVFSYRILFIYIYICVCVCVCVCVCIIIIIMSCH